MKFLLLFLSANCAFGLPKLQFGFEEYDANLSAYERAEFEYLKDVRGLLVASHFDNLIIYHSSNMHGPSISYKTNSPAPFVADSSLWITNSAFYLAHAFSFTNRDHTYTVEGTNVILQTERRPIVTETDYGFEITFE